MCRYVKNIALEVDDHGEAHNLPGVLGLDEYYIECYIGITKKSEK
jgi:hypothetical protein